MENFEINSSNLPGVLDTYQILDPRQLPLGQLSDRMIMAAVNSAPLLPNEPLPTSEIPSLSVSSMAALELVEGNRTSNSNGSDPIIGTATASSLVTTEFGYPLTAASRMLAADGEPTVSFELSASSGSEGVADVNLVVRLSAPSSQTVTVNYGVDSGNTASDNNFGSGTDYILTPSTLTFEPGTVTKTIPITIIEDSIYEANETINVRLSNPSNATLGETPLTTYKIVDNDRPSKVNVRDFGAVGDGIADDTQAIQRAIDATYSRGGGVVVFSPGTYVVTSVDIKSNITYQGYGAKILRPAMQPNFTRTFTTEYSGQQDSGPLIIKGLTFDGNSQNQGTYRNFRLEQSALLFLSGNRGLPGKLQAVVEDSTFQNGVADGIGVYTNVDIKAYNNQAIDVFRGGFVLTGGNSTAEVTNLTTQGNTDPTGIDIEVDADGYGGTSKVDVKLEGISLIDGDFDIGVRDGSTVSGNNIYADAPFSLFSENSTMRFTNSQFKIGASDGLVNRILFPFDVTFENTNFIATKKDNGDPFSFYGLNIQWQLSSRSTHRDQTLRFINSNFTVDGNITPADTTYAIYLGRDDPANNDNLVITGGSISSDFDAAIFRE
jgi:Pectate lyase superfamily protein/Calx-beta domain